MGDEAGIQDDSNLTADMPYFINSCCVDEVAAEHVSADCVVHFGHACLSPTSRLPVHYVFVDLPLDVSTAADTLCPALPADRTIVVFTDVQYQHALGEHTALLRCFQLTQYIVFFCMSF